MVVADRVKPRLGQPLEHCTDSVPDRPGGQPRTGDQRSHEADRLQAASQSKGDRAGQALSTPIDVNLHRSFGEDYSV